MWHYNGRAARWRLNECLFTRHHRYDIHTLHHHLAGHHLEFLFIELLSALRQPVCPKEPVRCANAALEHRRRRGTLDAAPMTGLNGGMPSGAVIEVVRDEVSIAARLTLGSAETPKATQLSIGLPAVAALIASLECRIAHTHHGGTSGRSEQAIHLMDTCFGLIARVTVVVPAATEPLAYDVLLTVEKLIRAKRVQLVSIAAKERKHRALGGDHKECGRDSEARNETILAMHTAEKHKRFHALYTNLVLIHGTLHEAIGMVAMAKSMEETAVTLRNILSSVDVTNTWPSLQEQMTLVMELDRELTQPLVEQEIEMEEVVVEKEPEKEPTPVTPAKKKLILA